MFPLVLFYLIGKEIEAEDTYWVIYAIYAVFQVLNLFIN